MSVGRLDLPFHTLAESKDVLAIIEAAGCELLILRYPTERWDLTAGIQHRNYVIWQADTLLYFSKTNYQDIPNVEKDFLVLDKNNTGGLLEAIKRTFISYGSHYATNPLLEAEDILDGYIEWASSFLEKPGSNLLASIDQGNLAMAWFCAVSIDHQTGEIVFGGIHPDYRNRGMYSRLLHCAEYWLHSHGSIQIFISTQAHNGTVIRNWVRNGFNYSGGINTLHIMPWEVFASRSEKS